MAKRLKLEDIKTESYCYVGDKLVNTKDLTQEQKQTLANKICLTLLRQRWGISRRSGPSTRTGTGCRTDSAEFFGGTYGETRRGGL